MSRILAISLVLAASILPAVSLGQELDPAYERYVLLRPGDARQEVWVTGARWEIANSSQREVGYAAIWFGWIPRVWAIGNNLFTEPRTSVTIMLSDNSAEVEGFSISEYGEFVIPVRDTIGTNVSFLTVLYYLMFQERTNGEIPRDELYRIAHSKARLDIYSLVNISYQEYMLTPEDLYFVSRESFFRTREVLRASNTVGAGSTIYTPLILPLRFWP